MTDQNLPARNDTNNDDVEGHGRMRAVEQPNTAGNVESNYAKFGLRDDDVEGHHQMGVAGQSDDTKDDVDGHGWRYVHQPVGDETTGDVAGHARARLTDDGGETDDVEGHIRAHIAVQAGDTDDDVDGHGHRI